jgi:hypothetical protein
MVGKLEQEDEVLRGTITTGLAGPQTPNTGGFELLTLPQYWGPGGGSEGIMALHR